jgi:hypothetical protein
MSKQQHRPRSTAGSVRSVQNPRSTQGDANCSLDIHRVKDQRRSAAHTPQGWQACQGPVTASSKFRINKN